MRILLAVAVSLLLTGPLALPAQAQEAEPTHTVVRFAKCSPTGVGIEWFQRLRPVVDEMIAEGRLLDYGILAHAWGDEWNVVDYFVVLDLGDFLSRDYPELRERQRPLEQEIMDSGQLPPWWEACREHKDVIYRIVPPTG